LRGAAKLRNTARARDENTAHMGSAAATPRTIVVTGASGFVGRHLVRALAERGHVVRAFDQAPTVEGLPPGATFVGGAIEDRDAVHAAVQGAEVVVHLAAKVDPRSRAIDEMQRANVNGAANVYAASIESGVAYFLHMSSAGVYGRPRHTRPYVETDETKPETPYQRTKWEAEQRLLSMPHRSTTLNILRPAPIYGVGSRLEIPSYKHVFQQRLAIELKGGEITHPTHVSDVTSAILAMIEHPAPHQAILNLGGASPILFHELQALIAQALRVPRRRIILPLWLTVPGATIAIPLLERLGHGKAQFRAFARGEVVSSAVDDSAFRARYPSVPVLPLRRGVEEHVAWARDTGLLTGSSRVSTPTPLPAISWQATRELEREAPRIAITGAGGFLGSRLVQSYLGSGANVRAIVHAFPSGVADASNRRLVVMGKELRDASQLPDALEGCRLVIHAAALTRAPGPDGARRQMETDNVEMTRNVIAACRRAGVTRLVHVSSTAAVGISPDRRAPADERFVYNLGALGLSYNDSKHQSEDIAVAANDASLHVIVVNPAFVFGWHMGRYRGGEVIARVLFGSVVVCTGGGLNVVHVDDVVDGIRRAATSGCPGERYILAGENLTFRDIAERVQRISGLKKRVVAVPDVVRDLVGAVTNRRARAKGAPPNLVWTRNYAYPFYASEKAKRDLGFQARGFEDIVADFLAGIDF